MAGPLEGENSTPRQHAGLGRRRPARPPILLAVGLLVGIVLAGCIGAGQRPQPSAGADLALTSATGCPDDVVDNCDAVRADPDAPYVIEDLHLVKDPPDNVQVEQFGPITHRVEHEGHLDAPTPGIRIGNLSRSLVVRDVEIEGYQTGLQIDNVTCSDCEIVVEDSRFVAGPCSAFGADLSCRDVIEGYRAEGIVSRVVTDTRAGYGIDAPADAHLTVRNTTMTGFVTAGISSGGGDPDGRLRLDNVTVRCRGEASPSRGSEGVFALTGSVVARRLEVSGCVDKALHVEFDETVEIIDSSISRSGMGMQLSSSKDPDGDADARIGDTEFVRNGRSGLVVTLDAPVDTNRRHVQIERSTFEGNGWNLTEEQIDEYLWGALLFDGAQVGVSDDGGTVTVRRSSFVGNWPYGAAARQGTIDARWNWWNASTGPSVRPSGGPTVPPGPADAVNRNVVFTPFLTAPPDGAGAGSRGVLPQNPMITMS